MKRYASGVNRGHISILPMCLDDMIRPDSEVRAIEAIVDNMDIQSMGFKYSETKETGRKPYSPSDMFKLYAYSYFNPRKENAKYSGHMRYQNYTACNGCVVKDKCSNSEKGRTIQDRPFQRFADEVDKRKIENPDMYIKRKQLVEHPFGTVKRAFGFSYFLTRGTESVRTESLLHFLVYNMKRVINIIGTEKLIEILQG